MIRLVVDPETPEQSALDRAAEAIRHAGVVALPTDTLYGLAVDPASDEAVRRLFAAKGRGGDRAVPLIAADLEQVIEQLGALSPLASSLAERFWPGPLTLLVLAPPRLVAEVSGGTGRVGVRVPAHQVARGLCRTCGHILTATSANPSGEPAPADPDAVAASLGLVIDVLLDAGKTTGGLPSTIVDVSGAVPQVIREGVIAWDEVRSCLRHS